MSMQDDRVLALAGMAQALAQVRRIADTGQADATVLATALDSVFQIDAESPAAVYGGEQALRPGLLLLRDYFRNISRDELLPRLALAVLQLERRFSRDPMAQRVHAGIVGLGPMAARLGAAHPDVLAAVGGLGLIADFGSPRQRLSFLPLELSSSIEIQVLIALHRSLQ